LAGRAPRGRAPPIASKKKQKKRTLNDGRVLDVADGGRVHDVAHNEALDGLVLGD
jgi:hypothetical protein